MKRICKRPLCALLALLLFLPSCGAGETDTSVIRFSYTCQPYYETKDELLHEVDIILVVKVKKPEIIPAFSPGDDPSALSIGKVERVIKGNLEEGGEIRMSQNGDNHTIIDTAVEESGGYLQKGQRWLLFLGERNELAQKVYWDLYHYQLPYSIYTMVGQYALDENDHITFMTDTSRSLLGDIQSVDDMEAVWQEYAAANP